MCNSFVYDHLVLFRLKHGANLIYLALQMAMILIILINAQV